MAVVLASDLLFTSRLIEPAIRAGIGLQRVDDPGQLPPVDTVALLIVDWSARQPGWGERITAWRDADSGVHPDELRIVLVGPHVDLQAHADARQAGLGPMIARSRLVALLPELFPADQRN